MPDMPTRWQPPKQIHNPTRDTNYPMSDRDWLSMVAAIHYSYCEYMGTRPVRPDFDDPQLPTTGPELAEMWLALLPVRDTWVDRVGAGRATKWRNAHLEQKRREHAT